MISEKEKLRGKRRYWDNIDKERQRGRDYYTRNLEKIRARRKANMPLLVERSERNRYIKKYGLTLEQVMIEKLSGCNVCGSYERLHVDHDHDNSEPNFRGILCQKCNQALGLLGEDVLRIEQLAHYIESFQR